MSTYAFGNVSNKPVLDEMTIGTASGWRVAQAGDGDRGRPAVAEEGVCVGVEVYPY